MALGEAGPAVQRADDGARDGEAVDRGVVPVDAQAGRGRRDRAAVGHGEPRRGDRVELRDVLDPGAVGHGGGERNVQLHQEVRAHRHVERLGQVRDLEPRRDAADPRAVDLHDRAGPALQVFAEVRRVVQRLADGDRHGRARGELDVPAQVLGGQRLLQPGEPQRRVRVRAAQRLGHRPRLVGVDHQLEVVADGRAHGVEPAQVLADRRLADLELGAPEPLRLRRERLVDELLRRVMQPSALGRVHRHRALRAAGHLPQRQRGAPAAQVPQRRVDRGQRQAGDRAHRGRMGVEEQALPQPLDLGGVLADAAAGRGGRAAAPPPTSRRCRWCRRIRCPSRRRRR